MQNIEFDYGAASVQMAEITWRIIWPIVFAFIAICWVIGVALWRYLSARVFEIETPAQAIATPVVEPAPVVVAKVPRRKTRSSKTVKAKTQSKSQTA